MKRVSLMTVEPGCILVLWGGHIPSKHTQLALPTGDHPTPSLGHGPIRRALAEWRPSVGSRSKLRESGRPDVSMKALIATVMEQFLSGRCICSVVISRGQLARGPRAPPGLEERVLGVDTRAQVVHTEVLSAAAP